MSKKSSNFAANFKKRRIMPVIYEYLGIIIGFYTNDHEPIHIHATYGKAVVKVVLHTKDGKVYRTTYQKVSKEPFPPAKMTQLKDFVAKHKEAMLFAWQQVFEFGNPIKRVVITKKI